MSSPEDDRSEAEYVCMVSNCDFWCNAGDAFQAHQEEHKSEVLKCPQCPYTTRHKGTLKSHIFASHRAQGKYKCLLCSFTAAYRSHLERHNRVHTRETPFKCDQCDFQTSRNKNLTIHKRIHLELRPFPCNLCTKSFRTMENLQSHTLVHTGEKPHKCCKCGHESARRSDLLTHQRSSRCKKMSALNVQGSSQNQSTAKKVIPTSKIRAQVRKPNSGTKRPEKPPTCKKRGNEDKRRSYRLEPDTGMIMQLPKRIEVPVLLPLQVLENWTPGQEAYATHGANSLPPEVTTPSHNQCPKSKSPEVIVIDSEEEEPVPTSSKLRSGNKQISKQKDADFLELTGEQQGPRTTCVNDAIVTSKSGRRRPYACAECTFTCFREDRLERHSLRNHPGSRVLVVQTDCENDRRSEQIHPKDNHKVRSSSLAELMAHNLRPSTEKITQSVARTARTTEKAIERAAAQTAQSDSVTYFSGENEVDRANSSVVADKSERSICEYCDKGFVTSPAWINHLLHHTGESLLKCKVPGCIFHAIDKQLHEIHEHMHMPRIGAAE